MKDDAYSEWRKISDMSQQLTMLLLLLLCCCLWPNSSWQYNLCLMAPQDLHSFQSNSYLMFCKWIKKPLNFFDHLQLLPPGFFLLLILKLDFGNKVYILCLCVYCFLRWDVRERHREDSYSHGERFLLRPTEGLTARDRGRPVTDKRRGKVSCIVRVGSSFQYHEYLQDQRSHHQT